MFSISESYSQKRYTFISKRLMKALVLPNDKALTGENLKVIADVTEQEIERPLKEQKSFYSGKKSRQSIKTLLIVCFLTGLILAGRSSRGTTHDFQILKKSNLDINPNANIKTDKGFIGIKELFQRAEVPIKASKYHPLMKQQKQYNRQLANQRTMIEHRNRECKIFRICKDRYRGKHTNYEKTWKLVSAIVNLKLSTRHLKNASPNLFWKDV